MVGRDGSLRVCVCGRRKWGLFSREGVGGAGKRWESERSSGEMKNESLEGRQTRRKRGMGGGM